MRQLFIRKTIVGMILVLGLALSIFAVKYYQDTRTHASTNSSQETEAGLLTGAVVSASDTQASGGQYVQFGINNNPSPTPSTPLTWDTNALTPPMGYNEWNRFHAGATEDLMKQIADAMVTNGMRDAGYTYINLDETWARQFDDPTARDAQGNLVPNTKFPSGIKPLADYIHSKGFKVGIYTSPGVKACAGAEGSANHFQQDVNTFASWGIDYIKLDWCTISYDDEEIVRSVTSQWKNAIIASGRPMILSIMSGSNPNTGNWSNGTAHMWRTEGDSCDSWFNRTQTKDSQSTNCYQSTFFMGIYDYLKLSTYNSQANNTKPNHWADADMMQVGNPGLSFEEAKTHFNAWAMWSSPLLAGNDPRNPTVTRPEGSYNANDILLNRDVIAVDQDRLGKPAQRLFDDPSKQVWDKQLSDGSHAVMLVNLANSSSTVSFDFSTIGKSATSIYDLWTHQNIAITNNSYTASLPAHGSTIVKIR